MNIAQYTAYKKLNNVISLAEWGSKSYTTKKAHRAKNKAERQNKKEARKRNV